MTSLKIVCISLPIRLVQTIDNQRHDVPRSKFVLRLLENALKIESNNVLGKDAESITKEKGTDWYSPPSWLKK